MLPLRTAEDVPAGRGHFVAKYAARMQKTIDRIPEEVMDSSYVACPADVFTLAVLKSDGLFRVTLCNQSQSCKRGTESMAACQDYAALNEVLQLSDVSWPGMRRKRIHHLLGNPVDRFLHPCGIFGHKVSHQQRDVFCGTAQKTSLCW